MSVPVARVLISLALAAFAAGASAKLPPPSDEAKAKAAEAKAKAEHGDKVSAYQLCRSQDKVAAHYDRTVKAGGKPTKPATKTAPCTHPGPFVYKS